MVTAAVLEYQKSGLLGKSDRKWTRNGGTYPVNKPWVVVGGTAVMAVCELVDSTMNEERRVVAQLKSESGEPLGSTFDLPVSVTAATLQQICNALLQQVSFCHCTPCTCTLLRIKNDVLDAGNGSSRKQKRRHRKVRRFHTVWSPLHPIGTLSRWGQSPNKLAYSPPPRRPGGLH